MKALLSCFHQGPSSSFALASISTTKTKLGLVVYPAPQESLTYTWIRSRIKYQGHKEFLTNLWRRWNAAARALLGRIQQRDSLQMEKETKNLALAVTSCRHTRDPGSQDECEGSKFDARDLSQLSRVVSDILTLMRMAGYPFTFPRLLTTLDVLLFVLASLTPTCSSNRSCMKDQSKDTTADNWTSNSFPGS
jgi:hypothetical protein